MTRRIFLKKSIAGSTGVAMATLCGQPWLQLLANHASHQERILVVIQLSGGNDGLNTVIPYRDEAYYKARPKLAIASESLIKLNDEVALNAALSGLEAQWQDTRFSIVQGVGYEQPNRSHFESMDIWHTCTRKTNRTGYGWLGGWLSAYRSKAGAASLESMALHLGHEPQPLALVSRDVTVPSIASLRQFRLQLGDRNQLRQTVQELVQSTKPAIGQSSLSGELEPQRADELLDFIASSSQTALQASQRVEKATEQSSDSTRFPRTQLGEKLQVIAQLITSQLPTRIYYVTLDGFDTHAQQPAAHTGLLRQWAEALGAFHQQMAAAGQADRVLVMTFSEFGRRVAENASQGTDHGAAAPLFLSGPKFKGTLIGSQPSLTDLDDGDLKFHSDFRCVYATIIERWFGPDVNSGLTSQEVLGHSYPALDLFA